MQVTGQNLQPQKQQVAQAQPMPQPVSACSQQAPAPAPTPQIAYNPVQNTIYPQYQPQNVQVPSTAAGVNIQIFNPSVSTAGAQPPTYNVNAPCYPANYYTGSVGADGKLTPNNSGVSNPHTGDNVNNGTNNGTIGDNNNNSYTTNTNSTTNNAENSEKTDDKKKTEKRKIVELTDEYIMNLENHLNSQEKPIRLNAAKEVYARLKEDDSRHDDKALNALINKMLQDPSEEIRIIALSALEERIVTGDDYTVNVLKNMQQNASAYGQDAIDASNILLKMSGRQVEKEFEVKDKPKKEDNKENKKA
jgi:hypothetical protein